MSPNSIPRRAAASASDSLIACEKAIVRLVWARALEVLQGTSRIPRLYVKAAKIIVGFHGLRVDRHSLFERFHRSCAKELHGFDWGLVLQPGHGNRRSSRTADAYNRRVDANEEHRCPAASIDELAPQQAGSVRDLHFIPALFQVPELERAVRIRKCRSDKLVTECIERLDGEWRIHDSAACGYFAPEFSRLTADCRDIYNKCGSNDCRNS